MVDITENQGKTGRMPSDSITGEAEYDRQLSGCFRQFAFRIRSRSFQVSGQLIFHEKELDSSIMVLGDNLFLKPTVLRHATAARQPDKAEPDESGLINQEASHAPHRPEQCGEQWTSGMKNLCCTSLQMNAEEAEHFMAEQLLPGQYLFHTGAS